MKNITKFVSLGMVLMFVIAAFAACAPTPATQPPAPAATNAPAATVAPAATNAPAQTFGTEKLSKSYYIGKLPITLSHAVHGNDAKWAKIYALEKYGANYEVIDPAQDLQKEIAGVETFISKGVNGLIIHPVTEAGVNQVIKEARDAGVYVVTYFILPTEAKVPHVSAVEAGVAGQMGIDMAKQWVKLYPDKPVKVGFIDFLSVTYCFDNRSGPFLTAVKTVVPDLKGEVTGIKNTKGEELLGATYWLAGEGDLTKAQAAAQDGLTKHPEVNIIYATNTPNALGTLSAYEAVGRGKAKDGVPLTEIIAGTDGDAPELVKIADPSSSLKYTLGMQPQIFAYAQVDTLMSVILGKIKPDEFSLVTVDDKYFNYYKDSVADLQNWFNTQYFGKLDINAELAKKK
jgi:ABC-type sugar transport system substrate-binding protein